MRTNKARLVETLTDMVIELSWTEDVPDNLKLVDEYAERIMQDIDAGIIQPERPV